MKKADETTAEINEKIHAAFDEIHAEENLKTRTKEYLSMEMSRQKKKSRPVVFRAAAAAACLLFVFVIGGSWMFLTPTAYISIDINPSLELGINRFDRVVSVEGFNDDGRDLADLLHIRFQNYNDAVETILNSQDIADYLLQDAVMTVTVAGETETQHDEILENVESCVSDHENVSCHSGSVEEMHEAHDSGLSFGKYRALLELQELDPSITADDIRDLSMKEIYDMIEEYSNNASSPDTSSDTSSGSSDAESDTTVGNGSGLNYGEEGDYGNGREHGKESGEHHGYGHHYEE